MLASLLAETVCDGFSVYDSKTTSYLLSDFIELRGGTQQVVVTHRARLLSWKT